MGSCNSHTEGDTQCVGNWCLYSKSWGIVGQWLSSSLGRQLFTVTWEPGGGCHLQDPCGEGLHCFLLLNPTYVSFNCRHGFVGLRLPLKILKKQDKLWAAIIWRKFWMLSIYFTYSSLLKIDFYYMLHFTDKGIVTIKTT